MHPAPSIILFTVLSGFGFGLLFWIGIGVLDVSGGTAFAFFSIAYVLAVGGLMASTFHLGHPERALKAFTQWRSSWLSREAWLSTAALIIMGLYGAGLVFFDTKITVLGWLGAIFCVATIFGTSMIYAQLKTVPRWNHWTTPLMFLAYGLTGGALLAGQITLGTILLFATGALQLVAWMQGDGRFAESGSTMATATGLGTKGDVRAFEPPHTGTNYLLTEMVHVVARKHASKLRIFAFIFAILIPWAFFFAFRFVEGAPHLLAAPALLSHIGGVLISRWLFFAEAEHVVGLYYGKR
jgi:DMSO reductase anchor subunit